MAKSDDLYKKFQGLVDNKICKVWDLGKTSTFGYHINVYEISAGLDKVNKGYAINSPSGGEKTGILFLAGMHPASEAQPPASMFAAAEKLVQLGKDALAQGADPDKDVTIINLYDLKQGRIAEILRSLDIFILPMANPYGYDNGQDKNKSSVNIDRNFDTLWNGTRNDQGKQYFISSKGKPPGWNCPDPGAIQTGKDKGKRDEQNETRIIKALMAETKIVAYVNFHTGYQRQVTYPWGFEINGTDPEDRYCNPDFENLPDKPNDGDYKEYMPASSLANLTGFADAIKDAIKDSNLLAKDIDDKQDYYYLLNGQWTPGPTGGMSNDYFFSQDVCTALSIHIEGGTPNISIVQVKEDNIVAVFAACDYLLKQIEKKGAALQRGPDTRTMYKLPCDGSVAGLGGHLTPLAPGLYFATKASPGARAVGAQATIAILSTGQAVLVNPAASGSDKDARCCTVKAEGQCGDYNLMDRDGFREQLIFIASQPGVPASPAGTKKVLAYLTITNQGPSPVTAFWDGQPPAYQNNNQSAAISPGSSFTVAAAFSLKVVLDAGGQSSIGDYVFSWCCPK